MSCTPSYEGLDMPRVNVFSDAPQLFWMDALPVTDIHASQNSAEMALSDNY